MRTSFSGRHASLARGARWSRERGCKGHRILRRVLVGGRHLGTSRGITFHEVVLTAALAASSHERYLAKRKRRQRCQRLDRSGRRGTKTPTPSWLAHRKRCTNSEGQSKGSACPLAPIRQSVHECREALGSPVNRREPKTLCVSPRSSVKARSRGASRERTRYGCTQIVQVAEVGQTHRASCPPEGRKTRWRARALAGRKLEAPPDVEHEPRKGETVGGRAFTIKSTCSFRLVGFGSQVLDTTEGVLGFSHAPLSSVGRRRDPQAHRSTQPHLSCAVFGRRMT